MSERRGRSRPEGVHGEDGWTAQRRERSDAVLAGTTPAQRLAWLEEAIAFARRAGALPRRTTGSS
ncbi:MAG: hypothetical protein L0206_10170 [Actinobacteria bacterium]|nr:hypothetical protein [Actinomycetota bacterium]